MEQSVVRIISNAVGQRPAAEPLVLRSDTASHDMKQQAASSYTEWEKGNVRG